MEMTAKNFVTHTSLVKEQGWICEPELGVRKFINAIYLNVDDY